MFVVCYAQNLWHYQTKMAILSFKIPSKYAHNFEDERKEEAKCRELHKEFKANSQLRYITTLYEETKVEIEDNGDSKLGIIEDVYDMLDKNWETILTYYALMDNQKSPFQIFKADYNEKSLCASQTLSISNELCSLIDYIKPSRITLDVTNTQRDIIRKVFFRVRCKYNAIASPYEWQNILDLQLHIYQTRQIALSSELDIEADKRAKVQADKANLMKELDLSQTKLRDYIIKYFGEESPIRDKAEQTTRIMTVFEEFTVASKDKFANIGQGKKW